MSDVHIPKKIYYFLSPKFQRDKKYQETENGNNKFHYVFKINIILIFI